MGDQLNDEVVDPVAPKPNTVMQQEPKAITEVDLWTKIDCSIIYFTRSGWIIYTLQVLIPNRICGCSNLGIWRLSHCSTYKTKWITRGMYLCDLYSKMPDLTCK
jgi:hypothetical protein